MIFKLRQIIDRVTLRNSITRRPMRPQISSRMFSNENSDEYCDCAAEKVYSHKYILICIDNFNGGIIESRGY